MTYAVEVNMDANDTNAWVYVLGADFEPIRYADHEQAEQMAQVWRKLGKEDRVRVVEVP